MKDAKAIAAYHMMEKAKELLAESECNLQPSPTLIELVEQWKANAQLCVATYVKINSTGGDPLSAAIYTGKAMAYRDCAQRLMDFISTK